MARHFSSGTAGGSDHGWHGGGTDGFAPARARPSFQLGNLEDVPEESAVKKALAHALLPLKLYREQAYGLPD